MVHRRAVSAPRADLPQPEQELLIDAGSRYLQFLADKHLTEGVVWPSYDYDEGAPVGPSRLGPAGRRKRTMPALLDRRSDSAPSFIHHRCTSTRSTRHLACTVLAVLLPALASGSPSGTPMDYACGPLLEGSRNLLVEMLDPVTGLPYDHLRCDCRWQSAAAVCQSSGVLPQLADADIIPFSQTLPTEEYVAWGFLDDLPGGDDPTLLYALELGLDLSQTNEFGGLIWGANADVSRYDRLLIRYRTSSPTSKFELKLNSGSQPVEPRVELPASPADGTWNTLTFDIATDFTGTDAERLNYLVLATSLDLAGEPAPTLWVDHLVFLADPVQAADCGVGAHCGVPDPGPYPDLTRYEPFTGAVNVANALSSLTVLSEIGLLDSGVAHDRLELLLDHLLMTPRVSGWMQDWHSPASLMPDPCNRIGSLTDLPQFHAALMVVEESWPDLAAKAASVRSGMWSLTDLWEAMPDGTCPGKLHWAMDVCTGPASGSLDYYGNDALLGIFFALATGAAPPELWSECLPRLGCGLCGSGSNEWYSTNACSCGNVIPATATGGPFLQLAGLTYLLADLIPIGELPLADSAANLLAAQRDWAADNQLALWGWANHSDAGSCAYLTCPDFSSAVATPYICGMGLDLGTAGVGAACAEDLFAFDQLGAGAPLDTGTVLHDFGLRDAWNQVTGTEREDGFLYLDTGWLALGAVNACHGELVRQRFAAHPVAAAGYLLLDDFAGSAAPCRRIFADGFESGDTSAWSGSVG